MKQFSHEYTTIVDNLRIMGEALVLLNPIKRININDYKQNNTTALID